MVMLGICLLGAGATADHAGKAAAAVNAVSGEQILKAIVDAAENEQQQGAAAVDVGEEKIGNVAANNNAAADKDSVNGIAKGMKGIVDAADGGKELKGGDAGDANASAGHLFAGDGAGNATAEQAGKAAAAVNAVSGEQILKAIVDAAGGGKELKDAGDGGGGNANADAGHLFGNAGGATAEQAGKAAAAVNAVSGEQILKAIVDAAEGAQQVGAAAGQANNPISAAIGAAQAGANFGAAMNGNDKIAAAIVLRGMAKDGKFAVQAGAAGADGASVKSAVDKAIEEISKKLKAIAEAAKAAAAVDGSEEKIGNVAANNNAAADKDSVNGIAKGMKGIVDAADGGKELKGGD
ncbi:variable large family protein, partial [Borreliella burgdorferi]|uniref:variable large family protein n=1 Tax=Borreliella burgdorferi TaxID=139 RepID=UPI001E320434